MNFVRFLCICIISLHCFAIALAADQPNIIIIVGDDLGYGELSSMGNRQIQTPNIDHIAAQGLSFNQAYLTAPVCAPSRAGLMTGRYQARFGYENLTGGMEIQKSDDRGVPPSEKLLPQYLQELGYATGAVGKWHLGFNPKYRPNVRGFDDFFGFLLGGHSYMEWNQPYETTVGGPILRNTEPVEGEGYLTERFTQEAVNYIESHSGKPFFLWVAYFNVHLPLDVPEKYMHGLPDSLDPDRRTMLGMIRALDTGVGDIVNAIDDNGIADNTLLIFLSDNGGLRREWVDNGKLSGGKVTLWEGGIRTPLYMRWPEKFSAGSTYKEPVSTLDFMPTILNIAGATEVPGHLDGVDLMPYIDDDRQGAPHDNLYWRFGNKGQWNAVRAGQYKYMKDNRGDEYLFDLVNDVAEQKNLKDQMPDRFTDLRNRYQQWNGPMPAVRF